MSKSRNTIVTVETTVLVAIEKAWELFTKPEHIINWNFATDEWHCPSAVNEFKPGGKFVWRMEAKDGSMGFDFSGIYENIILNKRIAYKLDDDRQVTIYFSELAQGTKVIETFDPENNNPIDIQREGWQAILENFKKYAEALD